MSKARFLVSLTENFSQRVSNDRATQLLACRSPISFDDFILLLRERLKLGPEQDIAGVSVDDGSMFIVIDNPESWEFALETATNSTTSHQTPVLRVSVKKANEFSFDAEPAVVSREDNAGSQGFGLSLSATARQSPKPNDGAMEIHEGSETSTPMTDVTLFQEKIVPFQIKPKDQAATPRPTLAMDAIRRMVNSSLTGLQKFPGSKTPKVIQPPPTSVNIDDPLMFTHPLDGKEALGDRESGGRGERDQRHHRRDHDRRWSRSRSRSPHRRHREKDAGRQHSRDRSRGKDARRRRHRSWSRSRSRTPSSSPRHARGDYYRPSRGLSPDGKEFNEYFEARRPTQTTPTGPRHPLQQDFPVSKLLSFSSQFTSVPRASTSYSNYSVNTTSTRRTSDTMKSKKAPKALRSIHIVESVLPDGTWKWNSIPLASTSFKIRFRSVNPASQGHDPNIFVYTRTRPVRQNVPGIGDDPDGEIGVRFSMNKIVQRSLTGEVCEIADPMKNFSEPVLRLAMRVLRGQALINFNSLRTKATSDLTNESIRALEALEKLSRGDEEHQMNLSGIDATAKSYLVLDVTMGNGTMEFITSHGGLDVSTTPPRQYVRGAKGYPFSVSSNSIGNENLAEEIDQLISKYSGPGGVGAGRDNGAPRPATECDLTSCIPNAA